jgi:L-aspartate oxidase
VPELARERELRALMSRHVGVIRDGDELATTLSEIDRIERTARSPGLRNMATAALLIAAAAWQRRESRGAHFRSDYPSADPAQAHRTFLTLADARAILAKATRGTRVLARA